MNNRVNLKAHTRPDSMPDPSVIDPAAPARLLLIDGTSRLAVELARPLAAEFASQPIVVATCGGRQALDALRSGAFDVVAADLDALADLADRIDDRIARLARAATGALILVLSEDSSISVTLAAMRAGAHDCVGKTANGALLVERMGELARRHGKSRAMTRSCAKPEAAPMAANISAEPTIPAMHDLVLPMWRQEQRIIESAIQSFAGNIALAAAALELSPSTIYRKRLAWAELDNRRAELASVSAR